MSWLERYSRGELRTKADIVGVSDDDYASAHSAEEASATNTIVLRLTPPFVFSPSKIQSEATIFNILPGEPTEFAHLRYPEPCHDGNDHLNHLNPLRIYERFSFAQPDSPRASMSIGTRAMKPTLASTDWYLGGTISPNVDDTPYLRYALEQLTRNGNDDDSDSTVRGRESSNESSRSAANNAYLPQKPNHVYIENSRQRKPPPKLVQPKYNPKDSLASLALQSSGEEIYVAQGSTYYGGHNPKLNFLPRTLRTWALALLTLAITLMVAGLLFCAEYSRRNVGLWEHKAAFDSRYVLFRYLAPILAAFIYVWLEGVMAAFYRINPYMEMTSDDRTLRQAAVFHKLYPSVLLLPRLSYLRSRQPIPGIVGILLFPSAIAIPLSSALFTTILRDGMWRYTASLPAAYTLAAIYILALLALLLLTFHLFRAHTGLRWDPRSLADHVALLSRSNNLDAYRSSELLTKAQMKMILRDRADMLGYWRTTTPTQGLFYGFGSEGAPARRYVVKGDYKLPVPRVRDSSDEDIEKGWEGDKDKVRFAYLPWYLSKAPVIIWPILFGALYVALLVVSFLPKTSIAQGFPPRVQVFANKDGSSPASFVYAFIPSLIGLLFYGALQKLYTTIARLFVWAELSKSGGETAEKSISLDYAASSAIPFGAVATAVRNSHWLIVGLGIMTPITLLLPVLAGGMLTTYTAIPSGILLVFPDQPGFYTLLVLLGLYLMTLVYVTIDVLWMGKRLRMPKKIEGVADLTSMLYASGLLNDAAFQGVTSKKDLTTRLLTARERGKGRDRKMRYFFGSFMGREGGKHLGVERVGRRGSELYEVPKTNLPEWSPRLRPGWQQSNRRAIGRKAREIEREKKRKREVSWKRKWGL